MASIVRNTRCGQSVKVSWFSRAAAETSATRELNPFIFISLHCERISLRGPPMSDEQRSQPEELKEQLVVEGPRLCICLARIWGPPVCSICSIWPPLSIARGGISSTQRTDLAICVCIRVCWINQMDAKYMLALRISICVQLEPFQFPEHSFSNMPTIVTVSNRYFVWQWDSLSVCLGSIRVLIQPELTNEWSVSISMSLIGMRLCNYESVGWFHAWWCHTFVAVLFILPIRKNLL
jgi:hypothetical protein